MSDPREQALLRRAQQLRSVGHVQGAIDTLKELLTESPEHAQAHALLSLCLIRQKRLHAAELEAGLALAADADESLGHLAMGQVAFARRKLDQAREHFETVRDLDPDEPEGYLALAHLSAFNGKRTAALADIERALALAPNDPDIVIERGSVYLEAGRLERAEADARGALELIPEHQDALVLMGRVLLQRGRVDDAYEHARWALRIDPTDSGALRLLAAIKARRNPLLGLWWRWSTWMHGIGSTRAIVLLLGAWMAQQALQIVFDESHYPELAGMIQPLWLGLVAYTWIGPMLFHNMLKRELEAVALRPDF